MHKNTVTMKTFKNFDDLPRQISTARRKMRIAVVRPADNATQEALRRVKKHQLAETVVIDDDSPEVAAEKAVLMIRSGQADMLMKGLIGTDQLLRAILNKETGLLPEGHILTHISVAEIPTYPKPLFFSDAAVIPYPTHEQRIAQVRYTVATCHRLGIRTPRIALVHCSEKPGKRFPFVDGYAEIKRMAADGDFGRCIVDGPLDVKSACSRQALKAKGISSPLNGYADVLIMPDIEAGNAFYKSMTLFAGARTAGMLCGARCPVVVPSRGDSAESKYNSILLALASL